MLQFLTDVAVPASVVLLMLIAGTEVTGTDFARLSQNRRAVLLGSMGQLLTLPLIALLVQAVVAPPAPIAAGALLLSLCPSGGISNYYVYLARCHVLLSATITATGTLLSLLTIPFWLKILPALPFTGTGVVEVPVKTVLGQLFALMVVPMGIGMLVRRFFPEWVARAGPSLKWFSIGLILLILAAAIATVRGELAGYLVAILLSAALFVLAAMLLGWVLGIGLSPRDRAVLVIESGVRNIGVVVILGAALVPKEDFGVFASFITGYFIVEITIMLLYARFLAARAGP